MNTFELAAAGFSMFIAAFYVFVTKWPAKKEEKLEDPYQETVKRMKQYIADAPTMSKEQLLSNLNSMQEYFDKGVPSLTLKQATEMVDLLVAAADAVTKRVDALTATIH